MWPSLSRFLGETVSLPQPAVAWRTPSPLALFPVGELTAVARGPVAFSCHRKLSDSETGQTTQWGAWLGAEATPFKEGQSLQPRASRERLDRAQVLLELRVATPVTLPP